MAPTYSNTVQGCFTSVRKVVFRSPPIALEYKDPDIAWVGQSKFIPHAWKHFGKKHIDIKVSVGETLTGSDGAELLKTAHDWTAKEVIRLRKEWDS